MRPLKLFSATVALSALPGAALAAPRLTLSGVFNDDADRLPWTSVLGKHIVLEEKVDGSEISFHFDGDANLILRERANNLDMAKRGGAEKVYDELKGWLLIQQDDLFDRLQDRFLVYGMWCLAAHTLLYDRLPSYLLEFDIQDKTTGDFLSTPRYCSSHIHSSSAGIDTSGRMEGVYGKVEEADTVTARFKWIRSDFIQSIIDGKTHWKDRPIVRNCLSV